MRNLVIGLAFICLVFISGCGEQPPPTISPIDAETFTGALPLLPSSIGEQYRLENENGFRQAWAFLTPRNMRYYFSITIGAEEIDRYSVSLVGNQYQSSGTTPDGHTWEFYPIAGGNYQVIVAYEETSSGTIAPFRIQDYDFRAIVCHALAVEAPANPMTWGVYPVINGVRKISPTSDYPVTVGTIVTVLSKAQIGTDTWYEILYPANGVLTDAANNQVTGWMHSDHLELDYALSPDCRYV